MWGLIRISTKYATEEKETNPHTLDFKNRTINFNIQNENITHGTWPQRMFNLNESRSTNHRKISGLYNIIHGNENNRIKF